MNRKQRNRHEQKMYFDKLRYGEGYKPVTTPKIHDITINKKKRRGQQIMKYYKRCKDAAWAWLRKEMGALKGESK